MPDDVAKEELRQLIDRYGPSLVESPARLKALLKDTVGEHRLEISLLVSAAEEGVAAEIAKPISQPIPPGRLQQLSTRLQDGRGLSPENARWAVEAWASALTPEVVAPEPISETPIVPVAPVVPVPPVPEPALTADTGAAATPARTHKGWWLLAALIALGVVVGGVLYFGGSDNAAPKQSTGGAAPIVPAPALVTVPPVVGTSQANAQAALTQAGFKVHVAQQEDTKHAPGIVLSQDPAGSTSGKAGSTVNLVVAKAPTPVKAPLHLTAAASSSSVVLQWKVSAQGSGIDHFEIVRDGTRIGTVPSATHRFTDPHVASGASYTYVVVAVGTNGTKSQTKTQSPVVIPSPPPAQGGGSGGGGSGGGGSGCSGIVLPNGDCLPA
jgi:PASTA domain